MEHTLATNGTGGALSGAALKIKRERPQPTPMLARPSGPASSPAVAAPGAVHTPAGSSNASSGAHAAESWFRGAALATPGSGPGATSVSSGRSGGSSAGPSSSPPSQQLPVAPPAPAFLQWKLGGPARPRASALSTRDVLKPPADMAAAMTAMAAMAAAGELPGRGISFPQLRQTYLQRVSSIPAAGAAGHGGTRKTAQQLSAELMAKGSAALAMSNGVVTFTPPSQPAATVRIVASKPSSSAGAAIDLTTDVQTVPPAELFEGLSEEQKVQWLGLWLCQGRYPFSALTGRAR